MKVVEKSEPQNKAFIMVPFPTDKLSASSNGNWTNSAIAVAIVVGICLVVLFLLLCLRCKKPSPAKTDNWWEVLPPQFATVLSTQIGERDSRLLGCGDPCMINCVPEPVSDEQVRDDEDEEPVFEMVDLPIKSKTTKVQENTLNL